MVRPALLLLPVLCCAATHPLAPLSAEEITATAQIIHAANRVPSGVRFSVVALEEPPKDAVLRGSPVPRRAFAVLYDAAGNHTWEAVANLETRKLDRLDLVPDVQPMVTGEDSVRADQIVREDPRWQRSLVARGIRDMNNVVTIAWTAGYFALPGTEQGRVVRVLPY